MARTTRALVCRAEPMGFGVFPSYDVARQYRIMDALAPTDVLVISRDAIQTTLGTNFDGLDALRKFALSLTIDQMGRPRKTSPDR